MSDRHGQTGRVPALLALIESPWTSFLARRAIGLVAVLFGLGMASFLMVRLIPGDPAVIVAGFDATAAEIRAVRSQLGIDQPVHLQFVTYWANLFRGELGRSFVSGTPVSELIAQRIGLSLQLATASLLVVLGLSLPLGILAGAFTREGRHRKLEVVLTALTSIVGSVPEYLIGTFLAFAFAVALRVLPVAGTEGWQSLILPTLAISLRPTAILTRIVRVETLNVLAMDYMRTARSERLPWHRLYLRHALPNVITAALTIGGILFSGVIGGAVVVENVFARTGLGTSLVAAVLGRDYPVIQGIILVLGAIVVVVNSIIDIALAIVDPRSLSRAA